MDRCTIEILRYESQISGPILVRRKKLRAVDTSLCVSWNRPAARVGSLQHARLAITPTSPVAMPRLGLANRFRAVTRNQSCADCMLVGRFEKPASQQDVEYGQKSAP